VILFADEVDTLRFRIGLHDRYVKEFLIVESPVTFSGIPKPLYASAALQNLSFSPNATVTTLTVPDIVNGTHSNAAWARELGTRRIALNWLAEHAPGGIALLSDIDEYLDVETLYGEELGDDQHGCVSPVLSMFNYCCACQRPHLRPHPGSSPNSQSRYRVGRAQCSLARQLRQQS